ncbi:unnamed protein product [Soboliphyme baturini]|uniref:SHSP domain-containing protein n=1 Tax=Soboliphyme baturini TaxID=241478 RepID=A0A183J8U9_9BILA|nr:unnamed protein product [Soboliphyme baturini]
MRPFVHPFWRGSDDWLWPEFSQLFDQNFAHEVLPSDLLDVDPWERMIEHTPYHRRPKRRHSEERGKVTGWSEVRNDKEKFTVKLDVSQFKPDELKVKTTVNMLIIEAHQKEHKDEHGLISRSFVRKYMLPKTADPQAVTSRLSQQGVLTIEAPNVVIEEANREREVPIEIVSNADSEDQKKQQMATTAEDKSPSKHAKKKH